MIPRSKQGRFGFLYENSANGLKGRRGAGDSRTNPGTTDAAGGVECPPWRLRCDVGGDGGAGREPGSPYLEKKSNTVEKEIETQFRTVEVDYVYVGCSCRSRFCPECSEGQGVALRERVRNAMKNWKHCQMWTLTIDPVLFGHNPILAYEYCKEKKVIGELVKALRRQKNCKVGKHYFCAVEWQKDTEFVHFHLLLETDFIPFETVCHYWNLFRPKWIPKPQDDRPGFGSVKFTSGRKNIRTVDHAINYATKYVIKFPEHGFPQWTLDFQKRIDRYHVSQGFWSQAMTPEEIEAKKKPEVLHESGCTCSKCSHEFEGRSKRRTHTERIEDCKASGCVLQRKIVRYPGGVEKRFYAYCFSVDGPYLEQAYGLMNFESRNETVLTLDEYQELKDAGRWSSEFEYDVHFSEQHLLFSDRPAIYEGEFQSGVLYEGDFLNAAIS